jgi:transposase
MEQRAVIRFFTLKGLPSRAIAAELESVYAGEALALSTVKKWRKRFAQGRTALCDDPRSGRPLMNDLAEAIASMLKERPFLSCKVLCRHFRIAKGSCLRILHDNLGMKKLNLRWVPHSLDANQKGERVALSHELLAVLERDRRNQFRNVVTGDESWFFLYYSHDSIWTQSRDEVPERISQKIDTEKCLLSVLWSVSGIHSLTDVPKGSTYNSAFLCDIVIPELVQNICSSSRRKSLKGMYIHLDNARPHNSRRATECLSRTKAKRVPHPAYSPDLAPSDFFLFGFLKTKLQEYDIPDRETLKSAISDIFAEISEDTLISVFEAWIKRLKWVIAHQGEYVHKSRETEGE